MPAYFFDCPYCKVIGDVELPATSEYPWEILSFKEPQPSRTELMKETNCTNCGEKVFVYISWTGPDGEYRQKGIAKV